MAYVTTVYKEENGGRARADVLLEEGTYAIEFFDTRGEMIKREEFPGKSIAYVEDAAENWAEGIKLLNE